MQLRFQGITVIKGKNPQRVMEKTLEKLNELHQKQTLMVSAFIPGKRQTESIILHGKDNTNFWVEQGLDASSPRSGLDAIDLQDKPDFLNRIKAYVKKYAKQDAEGHPPVIIKLGKKS